MTDASRFFRRGPGSSPGRHSMRRLAEKPASLLFFARSTLTKG